MHTTSLSLLEHLRSASDEQAWRRFVDLYTPLLFFWARRLGLQETDAADLVQEVFALLVRKLPEFDYNRRQSFRNWLRTVLHNKWRQLRRTRTPAQAGEAALDQLAAPDPLVELAEREFQQHLSLRALELLREEFQESTWKACWEHVVCGRSAPEVAEELGLSVNAVYLASLRVLRRLRQELAGLIDESSEDEGGG
jgi:RNA polymerase sigma-70 factor (ECF subfamily)